MLQLMQDKGPCMEMLDLLPLPNCNLQVLISESFFTLFPAKTKFTIFIIYYTSWKQLGNLDTVVIVMFNLFIFLLELQIWWFVNRSEQNSA